MTQPDSPEAVLDTLIHTYLAKVTKPTNATEKEAYDKKVDKLRSVTIAKLDEYYTNKFLELLKDEEAAFDDKYKLMYVGVRNQLRAELRQAIKQLSKRGE